MVQVVKNLPATWETRVQSLGWGDSLEEGMANCSSILAWRIPWTEEPGGLQSMGSQKVRHDLATTPPAPINTHTHTHVCIYTCIYMASQVALLLEVTRSQT